MAKFKKKDIVELQEYGILRAIGVIDSLVKDNNYNLYYSIDWFIVEGVYSGIRPVSLYPVEDFDQKGRSCPAGEVLYGGGKRF